MTFKIKYRNNSGAVREDIVEAASRAECINLLKTRGVTPLNIKTCDKVQIAGCSKSIVKQTSFTRKILVAVALIIVLLGCVFLLFNNAEGHKAEKKEFTVKTPDVISPKVGEVKPVVTNVKTRVLRPRKIKPKKRREPDATRMAPPPKIDALDLVKNSTVITQFSSTASRRLFKSDAENLIAGIISTRPGTMIINIPLDERFVREFKESVLNPITIEDGDTPEEMDLKQAMVDVKAELLQRMNKGEDIIKILDDAREDLNRLADYRRNLQEEYSRIRALEKTTPEELEEFRKEANELLKEYDLPPLPEPGRKPRRRKKKSGVVESLEISN